MRPNQVVLVAPAVEGFLARTDRTEAKAVEKFAFERSMEPLSLALRLWMVWRAVADANT